MEVDTAENTVATFVALAKILEDQEMHARHGVAQPEVYEQLMAIYLLEQDLVNMKFLWKRAPSFMKTDPSSQLYRLREVGVGLWKSDYTRVHNALQHGVWSHTVRPIMALVKDQMRDRALDVLLRPVYSYISVERFRTLIGLPTEEAVHAAVAEGCTYDAVSGFLTGPDQKGRTDTVPSSTWDDLATLVGAVCFFENP